MTPTDAEILEIAGLAPNRRVCASTCMTAKFDKKPCKCYPGMSKDEAINLVRASLAKWGTPTLVATKISIPTETMEQEFQTYYRRGYEAGKKAGTPTPAGEPAAWMNNAGDIELNHKPWMGDSWEPLYTAPPVREPLDVIELMRVVMKADEETRGFALRGTTNWAAHIGRAVQNAVRHTAPPVREPLADELAQKFEAMHSKGEVWITTIAAAAFVRAHGVTKGDSNG